MDKNSTGLKLCSAANVCQRLQNVKMQLNKRLKQRSVVAVVLKLKKAAKNMS